MQANITTEASRAKHKFAVKRNSWPKTRGVAMNPVDHVSVHKWHAITTGTLTYITSLTVVVIINISAKLRPFLAMLHRVKRPVSSRRGGRVCCVVLRRPRTKLGSSESCAPVLRIGCLDSSMILEQ